LQHFYKKIFKKGLTIYYTVGDIEKKVVLKNAVKEEFRNFLDKIFDTGLKLPTISEKSGLNLKKLRNIRNSHSSGNIEMLQKLLSAYHYVLFPNEPEEEEVLKPIVIEAIKDIVGEELSDKLIRVEKENLELYKMLVKMQARQDAMDEKLKNKE